MRLARSGRAALSVLHGRDVLLIVTAVIVATLLAVALLVAQVDAARTRSQSVDQAQAQRDQAIDARQAQTRRIDQLTEQVDELHETAREQAVLIGRQEQAIRDLAAQVSHGGQSPVVTSVAPRRTATRTPTPTSETKPTARTTKPTTAPTTAPKPPAVVRPAPAKSTDDGLICGLLPIIC